MGHTDHFIDDLYRAILSLESVEECKALLSDLCTFKEVEQMAQRLKSAELLLEGKTYSEVIEATSISSATLSRVSREIQVGSGGYKMVIDRIKK